MAVFDACEKAVAISYDETARLPNGVRLRPAFGGRSTQTSSGRSAWDVFHSLAVSGEAAVGTDLGRAVPWTFPNEAPSGKSLEGSSSAVFDLSESRKNCRVAGLHSQAEEGRKVANNCYANASLPHASI